MNRILRVIFISSMILLSVGCKDKSQVTHKESHQDQRWLTIYNDGVWEKDVDVSGFEIGGDVIILGARYDQIYYPWQGENSIDYWFKDGLLSVNGKVVGLTCNYKNAIPDSDATRESLEDGIPEIRPEDILTFSDSTINPEVFDSFSNLLVFELSPSLRSDQDDDGAKSQVDLKSLAEIPERVLLYIECPADKLKEIPNISNLRGVSVWPYWSLNGIDLKPLKKHKELTHLATICNSDDLKYIGKLTKLRRLLIYPLVSRRYDNYDRTMRQYSRQYDRALRHVRSLDQLRELYIVYGSFSDDGIFKSIAQLRGLNVLSMHECYPSVKGCEHLARLSNLRELKLYECALYDSSLVHISKLKELRRLILYSTPVRASEPSYLNKLENLRQLELVLISDSVPHDLAGFEGLPNLEELKLDAHWLSEEGVKALTRFENLRVLNVSGFPWPDPSFWLQLGDCKNLKQLHLDDFITPDPVIDSIVQKLHEMLPDCQITTR